MTRLTNAAREKIANMIMDHKFKAPIAAMDKRQESLGLEAYNHRYTKRQRGLMADLMATAPKRRVLLLSSSFGVNVGGWNVTLKLATPAPVFEDDESSYGYMFSLNAEDPLGARIQQYATDRKDLDAQQKTLREQVDGQLAPHYTFERLTAAWPEIERFASAVERGLATPISAPALIDHRALNVALDLPPEIAVAA